MVFAQFYQPDKTAKVQKLSLDENFNDEDENVHEIEHRKKYGINGSESVQNDQFARDLSTTQE